MMNPWKATTSIWWEVTGLNKLLRANFARLWKNRLFLAGLTFMFLFGSLYVLKQYQQVRVYQIPLSLESTFFTYAMLIGVLSAIFCSLFLGTEYGDGTMRNKIIAGHKRTDIYLSNLIVNLSASFLMCLSYIFSNVALGIPLLGFQSTGLLEILRLLLGSCVTVAALCSVFTMVSLLIQNKALAPVVCIVGMFLMLGAVSEIKRMLDQPQYYYDNTKNNNYLEGETREKFEFLYNFLPAGQEMQYAAMKTENIGEMCLYSLGITIAATGVGTFFFRKKDIK